MQQVRLFFFDALGKFGDFTNLGVVNTATVLDISINVIEVIR